MCRDPCRVAVNALHLHPIAGRSAKRHFRAVLFAIGVTTVARRYYNPGGPCTWPRERVGDIVELGRGDGRSRSTRHAPCLAASPRIRRDAEVSIYDVVPEAAASAPIRSNPTDFLFTRRGRRVLGGGVLPATDHGPDLPSSSARRHSNDGADRRAADVVFAHGGLPRRLRAVALECRCPRRKPATTCCSGTARTRAPSGLSAVRCCRDVACSSSTSITPRWATPHALDRPTDRSPRHTASTTTTYSARVRRQSHPTQASGGLARCRSEDRLCRPLDVCLKIVEKLGREATSRPDHDRAPTREAASLRSNGCRGALAVLRIPAVPYARTPGSRAAILARLPTLPWSTRHPSRAFIASPPTSS